jgi:hypothetical protein
MEEVTPRMTVIDLLGYLLAYLCWLLVAAVSLLAALLMRNTLNVVWPIMGGSHWILRAVDRFGLVGLGLIWLVYVILAEHNFRSAITDVRFRRLKLRARPLLRAAEAQLDPGTRVLRRYGLDLLLQRVVPTVAGPVALLALSYVIENLAWSAIAR